MNLCTACNEFSALEYFDRYDDEIYIKCRICGKIQTEFPDSHRDTQKQKDTYQKEMRKL